MWTRQFVTTLKLQLRLCIYIVSTKAQADGYCYGSVGVGGLNVLNR